MKTWTRTARLTAIAAGVFGFSASLTAFAAVDKCHQCYTDVLEWCEANTPDATPSCWLQYRACLTANRCQIVIEP
ncbi:hypothetical protein IEQ11_15440 [Lysobacter capsici]|jgi:hypothetical protein|uniref:Lipoprotein n=1 Tax=Lysobacter capsici AZ78 TaxID=1444315 RepID=A0A108U480_9GAMM|nr:hypothetical protein [Lysobacter capsici]ALN86634.1 hypothetical protein LC55x_3375 [Lysobacter capsici]ATE72577.1 hypothetical protein CNO08_15195 [Lysobacter capsici]KWS02266.1 hypothetical protein AZ78_4933 [Lysobacter capsici AZ78]UOF13146.1 hypothetical protein IEQ11_15440 [Lysobacter capsici]WND78706.1 hypothetical protein RJ610_15475 [Lysobacter capsici]